MFGIKKRLKSIVIRKKWKDKNIYNFTSLAFDSPYDIDIEKISVRNGTYGTVKAKTWGSDSKISIGSFCSIGEDVVFISSLEHPLNLVSTFPFKTKFYHSDSDTLSKGDIIVDDDVWIGYRATILSGVHIGQGAVIAAGAVVSKNVPPYAVVGGVPARIIKYRFSSDVIKTLLTIDYSQLTKEHIEAHIDDLYSPLDDMTAAEVEEKISWMPRKRRNRT